MLKVVEQTLVVYIDRSLAGCYCQVTRTVLWGLQGPGGKNEVPTDSERASQRLWKMGTSSEEVS